MKTFTVRPLFLTLTALCFACGGTELQTKNSEDPVQEAATELRADVMSQETKFFGPFNAAPGAITVTLKGNGNADLSVRLGTTKCDPKTTSTNETCKLKGPGQFFVTVTGVAQLSTFSLQVRYTAEASDGGAYDGGSDIDGGAYDGGSDIDGGAYDGGSDIDGGAYDGGSDIDGGAYDGGSDIDGGAYDGGSESADAGYPGYP